MFVPATCVAVSIDCSVAGASPDRSATGVAFAFSRSAHTRDRSVRLVRYWISSRSAYGVAPAPVASAVRASVGTKSRRADAS